MRHKSIILAMLLTLLMGACDTVDCTLNNNVLCYIGFYDGHGKNVALTDTLSIMAYGTDEILFNRGVGKSRVAVPMSFYNEEDTFIVRVWGPDYDTQAEISLGKTNTEYFESIDCPVKMMHNLTNAYVNSGNIIDSVVIVKPSVNFQQDENIRIYFHSEE